MLDTILPAFDIRQHQDKLELLKTEGSSHIFRCPKCGGERFGINQNTGAYSCHTTQCSSEDIREAIAPIKEVLKANGNTAVYSPYPSKPTKRGRPKNTEIPEVYPENLPYEICRIETPEILPAIAVKFEDIPPAIRKALTNGDDGATADEVRNTTTLTTYDYGKNRFIQRWECSSAAQKNKGRKKTFGNKEIDLFTNQPVYKKTGDWNAYQEDEAIAAIIATPQDVIPVLFSMEGEKCCDRTRLEGAAAITWANGGSDKEKLATLEKIRESVGRKFLLCHVADNDKEGLGKADKLHKVVRKIDGVYFLCLDIGKIESALPPKGDIVELFDLGWTVDRIQSEIITAIAKHNNDVDWLINTERTNSDSEQFEFTPPNQREVREVGQIVYDALYCDRPWKCISGKLHRYENTWYRHIPDDVELAKIADFCDKYAVTEVKGENQVTVYPFANSRSINEALNYTKLKTSVSSEHVNKGVNCTNGVLTIDWDGDKPIEKLIPHSPEIIHTYEPMVKFNPNADPSHCDRLLEVLDAPQREVFVRVVAASLDLETVRKHKGRMIKALLLRGDGANGKDSLREAVRLVYGSHGLTGATLSDFHSYDEGRKFPLSKLRFSKVNWASENTNHTKLDKVQSLKAFITGDPLESEQKGKDSEEFIPNAIALFNVNDTPNLQSALEAIQSRYSVLSFLKVFKVDADPSKGELEADPRFKYDPVFMRESVCPAFLNRMIQSLKLLMSEGIDYSCTKAALEAIQVENCHLYQFCKDTGLGYSTASEPLRAIQIWNKLYQWYQDNGTVELVTDNNGKVKTVWSEQAKPSDRNIKAVNQVIARFKQLFPKSKEVAVYCPDSKRNVRALIGVSFAENKLVEEVAASAAIAKPELPDINQVDYTKAQSVCEAIYAYGAIGKTEEVRILWGKASELIKQSINRHINDEWKQYIKSCVAS